AARNLRGPPGPAFIRPPPLHLHPKPLLEGQISRPESDPPQVVAEARGAHVQAKSLDDLSVRRPCLFHRDSSLDPRRPRISSAPVSGLLVLLDSLDREDCAPGGRAGIVEPDDLTHGPSSFARSPHRHGSEATSTTVPNRE